jgi:hypothetical protein
VAYKTLECRSEKLQELRKRSTAINLSDTFLGPPISCRADNLILKLLPVDGAAKHVDMLLRTNLEEWNAASVASSNETLWVMEFGTFVLRTENRLPEGNDTAISTTPSIAYTIMLCTTDGASAITVNDGMGSILWVSKGIEASKRNMTWIWYRQQ